MSLRWHSAVMRTCMAMPEQLVKAHVREEEGPAFNRLAFTSLDLGG